MNGFTKTPIKMNDNKVKQKETKKKAICVKLYKKKIMKACVFKVFAKT